MPTPRMTSLFMTFVALTFTAAACKKGSSDAPKPTPESAKPPPPPSPASTASVSVLKDIPGLDFSSLPEPAQRELATVFTDEFCYCGCPHALGACLRTHECKHARRMALLAAGEAAAGVPAAELILQLSRYYQSFSQRRAQLQPEPGLCKGSPDAKVTLVEFSDFECPHCAAVLPSLQAFMQKRKDTVRLCWMPFPLSFPNSNLTAQAALFARDGGKFWQVHDALFAQQAALDPQRIRDILAEAGLSVAAFEKAVSAKKFDAEISAAKAAGRGAGVDSTPSIFVNGRKLVIAPTEALLEHTVQDELEWQANGGAWAKD